MYFQISLFYKIFSKILFVFLKIFLKILIKNNFNYSPHLCIFKITEHFYKNFSKIISKNMFQKNFQKSTQKFAKIEKILYNKENKYYAELFTIF